MLATDILGQAELPSSCTLGVLLLMCFLPVIVLFSASFEDQLQTASFS